MLRVRHGSLSIAVVRGGAFARRLLGDKAALPAQLSRYILVSLVAVAADFGLFVVLAWANGKASLAGVLGYAAGMLVHYLLSSRFVFDSAASGKSEPRQLVEFALSGLAGLSLTGLIIAVATEAWGLTPVAAKVIAVLVSFAAVFLIRRCFVFAPDASAKSCEAGSLVYAKSGSSR
jgi:putative flippase GtrA